jgi:hypothetical protein
MGVCCSRDHTQEQLSREQLLQELNLTIQALQKCEQSRVQLQMDLNKALESERRYFSLWQAEHSLSTSRSKNLVKSSELNDNLLHSLQASSDRVKFLTNQVAELEDQKDQVFKHTQIFPV